MDRFSYTSLLLLENWYISNNLFVFETILNVIHFKWEKCQICSKRSISYMGSKRTLLGFHLLQSQSWSFSIEIQIFEFLTFKFIKLFQITFFFVFETILDIISFKLKSFSTNRSKKVPNLYRVKKDTFSFLSFFNPFCF